MRKRLRFVPYALALAFVLVLAAIVFTVVIKPWVEGSHPAQIRASTSNLQTALTAAKSYYDDSGRTFLGLMNSGASSTSSIQEMDTGLSFISEGPSTGPHFISTEVGTDSSYLVLTAFANGTNDCWGILDIERRAGALGIAESPGTYFFVIRDTTTSACNAAKIKSVSASSTAGFPHG
jgi:type II secretory pathway pseudopilin PulG